MKTIQSSGRETRLAASSSIHTCRPNLAVGPHIGATGATRLLTVLMWLSLTLPVAVRAQFEYTTANGAITITGGCPGTAGAVTIPGTINGLPVTSIGGGAFSGCTGLSSVTIPNSVTSIGGDAFAHCTGLTSVTIPDSVTSIGDGAFYECINLTTVTIGNGVISIGVGAFAWCTSLREVYFQGDAPTLGLGVFGLSPATIYYLAGTAGWDRVYVGRPTIRVGPPELDVRLYAGLSITGAVGTVYSVEYVSDLAQTNNASAWQCLEYLRLPASPYLWADKSGPATGQRFYRAVATEAPTNMIFIPPGTFMMGSPPDEVDRRDDEGPQTAVTISRGYWLGKYEVTQGEYLAVMGSNPSWFSTNYGFVEDLSRPVEDVDWYDATNYCAALTQREVAAGRIGTNSVYRLPTEAEWEYACRGLTSTRHSYGDDPGYTNLTNYAWYWKNSGEETHAVGQKLPNPWGLYDMHGNVYEWCQDRYAEYAGGIAVDPRGPDSGKGPVVRGGSWLDWDDWSAARGCRSAARSWEYRRADGRYRSNIGFRVVLAPGQP